MIYSIVTADYDYDTNDINLYCRSIEGERKTIKVTGFEPYFYIPEKEHLSARREETSLLAIDGTPLSKIITKKPRDVKRLRQVVPRHFEADILFPSRLLIDTNVKYSFEIPKDRTMIHWSKLKPVDVKTEPRKVYCDIETYSKGRRFPLPTDDDAKVTINCMYDSQTKKYLTLIISNKETQTVQDNHIIIHVKDEKTLIEKTIEFLNKVNPDIFTAWSLSFDKDYLEERAKIHNLKLPWNETNPFCILKGYKKLYHKSNNALKEIVKAESFEVPDYQPFMHEMWEREDKSEAIKTNKSHVESIVVLDEKKRILDFYWDLKRVVGFTNMSDTLFHGKLVDMMLLRYYHNKWVLPSNPSEEEKKRRKKEAQKKVGGKVLTPPFGVFYNLGVFDMSRYYPEMLISQNLSPEPHGDELGVVPQMTLDLLDERLRYDHLLSEHTPGTPEWKEIKFQRNSVKFVTESIIGYFGSESSRVYNLDTFNSVTMMGQRGITFLQKKCNEDGNNVIYFDTDGATVSVPSVEYAIDYVDTLNGYLKEFCREEGITRDLVLKLDRFYSVYLIKKKTERINGKLVEHGVKKRYCGKIVWEDGKPCDYLAIKGFEYVRRDSPPVTKKIQPTIFDLIFEKKPEKVKEYLKNEVSTIRRKYKEGELSLDDLAIPVTLNQPLTFYGGTNKRGNKKGIPPYARGAIYSNEWFGTEIRGGDQIKMLYVEKIKGYPPTDVISYLDEPPDEVIVDIEKMIDNCIRKKVDKVIELIGLEWDEIFSRTVNLLEA